jgi:hypothetical protein
MERRQERATNREADQADLQQQEAAAQQQSPPRDETEWLDQAEKMLTRRRMASEE